MAAKEGTFSVIIDKVSFLKQVPWLMKATSDDDSPTPGYMYQEICDISLASGSYCQTLLDYLLDRLDKESCQVKMKVLRIMQFVIQNGHPDFRQGLRRRARGVQEAAKYSGPPDPLHGNTPYVVVRKAAQDLSQMLFDVSWDDGKVPEPQHTAVKTAGGMGSSFYGNSMQGFGNTPTGRPNKTFGETLVGGLMDFAERVADPMAVDPRNAVGQSTADPFRQGDYRPVFLPSGASASEKQPEWERVTQTAAANRTSSVKIVERTQRQMQKVVEHRPGVAGGGWEDDPPDPCHVAPLSSSTTTTTRHATTPSDEMNSNDSLNSSNGGTPVTQHAEIAQRLEDVRVEDVKEEEQLVEDIVIRSQTLLPSRHDVNTFIKRCSESNSEIVITVLNRHLQPTNEQNAFRALLLLDYLMKSDQVSIDHIAFTCASNLVALYRAAHGTTKAKARKVVRQLQLLSGQMDLFTGMPTMPCQNQTLTTDGPGNRNTATSLVDNAACQIFSSPTNGNVIGNNSMCMDSNSNHHVDGLGSSGTMITNASSPHTQVSGHGLSLTFQQTEVLGGARLHVLVDQRSTDSSPEWPSLHIPFAGSVYSSQLPASASIGGLGVESYSLTSRAHDIDSQEHTEDGSFEKHKDSSMSEDSLKDEDSAFDFLNE